MKHDGTRCCNNCLWYEQCGCSTACEDYSPIDEQDAFTYYEAVLVENAAEYSELVAEMRA